MVLAVASAGHVGLGWGGWGGWGGHGVVVGHAVNPAAHIPSGSVSVGPHGATVAGPAGSVSTDNGAHGRAGAVLAGPSGTVAGWGAHGTIEGPAGHAGHGWGHGGWAVGHGAWGHGLVGGWGHGHGW